VSYNGTGLQRVQHTAEPLYRGDNITPEQSLINQDYVTQTQKYYDQNPVYQRKSGKGGRPMPQALPQQTMPQANPIRGIGRLGNY